MKDPENGRAPFDEQAALAELERLAEECVRLRSKRVEASVDFDRFVRSLKNGELAPDPARISVASVNVVAGTVPSDVDAKVSEPAPLVDQGFTPAAAASAARRQPGSRNLVLLGGALLLLSCGGWVTWTLRKAAREPAQPDRIASAPPAATSEPAVQPASSESIPSSPYDSQITTTRPVWVRVVADGQRVVERELPAQTRVPFRATSRIVIRAGDAGGLRLSIGGRDQGPLGADGVVVTRTFAVPDVSTR